MKILLTGSAGFLGSHLYPLLSDHDVYPVLSRAYDLRQHDHIDALFDHFVKPDIVYHLAANVGGISYNMANPASIYYDNVMMNTQLIQKCAEIGVGKFVFVSSVCAYPDFPLLPMKEGNLWSGYPEKSNGSYGISKRVALAQLEACREQYGMAFEYPIPVNMYGPRDNFGESGHVIAALVRKFIEAKEVVTIWGDGKATRDFLYAGDVAKALSKFIDTDVGQPVNISSNQEVSIAELVDLLVELTGFDGTVAWDKTKPTGEKRRLYDNSRAKSLLGWQPETSLIDGLRQTIEWYRGNKGT